MEAVTILEKPAVISWDYDEEADVLYLSIGEARPAVGVDVGEGVIVRYDEAAREVVGLTLIGLRARLLQGLPGACSLYEPSTTRTRQIAERSIEEHRQTLEGSAGKDG